jgi:hypothetical protein
MNTSILKQAKRFENEEPTYSSVKAFCSLASVYQEENEVFFLEAKRGKRVKILHLHLFFEFLSDTQNFPIKSFQDIETLLTPYQSRKENILHTGDSKSNFIKVFDGVVLVKKAGELAQLYPKENLYLLDAIEQVVAIENAETFLNIENKMQYFSSEYFVYLSGYANTLTREFLENKSVEFFVDYDIEGMNIYESFTCVSKKLHIPIDIEAYFTTKLSNKALYLKQRKNLKTLYSPEAQIVIDLIKEYSSVVEQEIIYETY